MNSLVPPWNPNLYVQHIWCITTPCDPIVIFAPGSAADAVRQNGTGFSTSAVGAGGTILT